MTKDGGQRKSPRPAHGRAPRAAGQGDRRACLRLPRQGRAPKLRLRVEDVGAAWRVRVCGGVSVRRGGAHECRKDRGARSQSRSCRPASWQGTASALSARSRGSMRARRGSGRRSPSDRTGASWTVAIARSRVGPRHPAPGSRMRASGRSSSRAVASVASASASDIAPSRSACARMASAVPASTGWGRLGCGARRRCGAATGPPGRSGRHARARRPQGLRVGQSGLRPCPATTKLCTGTLGDVVNLAVNRARGVWRALLRRRPRRGRGWRRRSVRTGRSCPAAPGSPRGGTAPKRPGGRSCGCRSSIRRRG
jgi:hypothetical protein